MQQQEIEAKQMEPTIEECCACVREGLRESLERSKVAGGGSPQKLCFLAKCSDKLFFCVSVCSSEMILCLLGEKKKTKDDSLLGTS